MAAKEPSPATKKGILKLSRQPSEPSSKAEDGIKWDEMNILATYHPEGKDYGHMKIDEPDTPYNKYQDPDHEDDDPHSDTEGGSELSPADVSKRLEKDTLQKRWWEQEVDEESSEEENEDLTEDDKAKKIEFESKRKQHYNEAMFMKRAKQLIAEEFEEDEDEDEEDDCSASAATEESVQEEQS